MSLNLFYSNFARKLRFKWNLRLTLCLTPKELIFNLKISMKTTYPPVLVKAVAMNIGTTKQHAMKPSF